MIDLLLAQAADNPIADHLVNPIVQAGFAGFCAAMLVFIAWLVKQLIGLQHESNQVIGGNTEALNKVVEREDSQITTMIEIKDLLLSRPCLKEKQGG